MKRKWMLTLSLLAFGIGIAAAAYTYTGPKRTITYQELRGRVEGQTCVYLGGWRYIVETTYNCNEPGEPWKVDYPDYYYPCSASTDGNRVYAVYCALETVTEDLPPATVSGDAVCGQPGENGWCTDGAALNLSGTEPLPGYSITGIESTLGMLCSSSSCAWPFPEGNTSLSFWALSSYGDTSLQGSASMQVDTVPPQVTFTLPALDGADGWYLTPVTVSASAMDATSGVGEVGISVDGEIWQEALVLADGVTTLRGRAADLAGNQQTVSTTMRIDTLPPTADFSVDGTLGTGGWYTSIPHLSVFASDATSGVAAVEICLDGGEWQSLTALNIPDGIHNVDARVTDQAGNTVSASTSLSVDTQPPQSAFTDPADGSTTTVSGQISLSGQSLDALSGLAEVSISFDDGLSWQPLTPDAAGNWSTTWDTTGVPNGTYPVRARAADLAGNLTLSSVTLVVSNPPPAVSLPASWWVAASAPVSITAMGIPLAGARLTIPDPAGSSPSYIVEYGVGELPAAITWDGRFPDGRYAAPGSYPVILEAWDRFGSTGQAQAEILVPDPPTPTLPPPTPQPPPTIVPPLPALPAPTAVPSLPPTSTATATPEPTLNSPTSTPSATMALGIVPLAPPVEVLPLETEASRTREPVSRSRMLWPVFGFVALLAAVASSSLSDPRPQAIRRLQETLDAIQDDQT